jgi:ubiquinone/menaquinone biosynthesis C-methylase UbiE
VGRDLLGKTFRILKPGIPSIPMSNTEDITNHYASGYEEDRLNTGIGQLERERTRELLMRFLPRPSATILDAGGGPGEHACWLAKKGYQVHLIDITPLHVEMAKAASGRQPDAPLASASVGDARSLSWDAAAVDAVLMLGPLYHLTEREDRVQALREAHRVLKPGGVLMAVGVSRFASTLDGLRMGYLKDPVFAELAEGDLRTGRHRNPTKNPKYFTDTFFHSPPELRAEVVDAGFTVTAIYGIQGPGWLAPGFDEWWSNPDYRERLLKIARILEAEPAILGISTHLMIVAKKPIP